MLRSLQVFLALAFCGAPVPGACAAPLPLHQLDNGSVRATVTEAIGGRLLSFSLAGRPNFLRVDPAAGDPGAAVDAEAGNVGYLGHEVWAGPQQEWWTRQTVNPARAAARAPWPPDPYLSLARYTLEERTAAQLAMTSPASPVNGLQLRKRYALVEGRPNSLRLEVEASNRRATPVAWDIWFNTRVHADTRVYVPVASAGDIRLQASSGAGRTAPGYTVEHGMFSLDVPARGAAGGPARLGKLFLQPAAGWMAAFRDGQAFIIQFSLQPRSAIHPDQGQVELYHDYRPGEVDKGILEMEVHAPYLALAPGATMEAAQLWTILPYDGPATRAAHLAFLRAHAQQEGLGGL
ncbi:DUF4380 domain-containing protein [Massilia niastensis]|uniref:DUF4380 domain-containing protein n=1 Tax=Massilia niastensis TaxID=544911 RepID=UPI00036F5829|nr:DUF4380 domain-containing protein [Massilia niastensis]